MSFFTVTPMTEANEPFTLMVVGDAGIGKTTFVGSFADARLKPAIFVDTDRGATSIKNPKRNIDIMKLTVDNVFNLGKLPAVLGAPDTAPQKPDWAKGVKTVIIDSLSAFYDSGVSEGMLDPSSKTPHAWQAGQTEYLRAQNLAMSTLTNLKSLPDMNLLTTVAVSHRADKGGLALSPGIRDKILYTFSYIFVITIYENAKTGGVLHFLHTEKRHAQDVVKVRHSGLRNRIHIESEARLRAAGLVPSPATVGYLPLADPNVANYPDYMVTLDDVYSWYCDEVLTK